jgi:hypothetical protein
MGQQTFSLARQAGQGKTKQDQTFLGTGSLQTYILRGNFLDWADIDRRGIILEGY